MLQLRPTPLGRTPAVRLAALAALTLVLVACGPQEQGGNPDPNQVDSVAPPKLGACRLLTSSDVAMDSNATRSVDCSKEHTAQTFAVGDLPADVRDTDYGSPEIAHFAYRTCTAKLQRFLGADESTAMRTVLTWAWFRPSQRAWDKGARWYRCDVVAGGDDGSALIDLPPTARGLLAGRPPDQWLACVHGPSVDGAAKIPCSQAHDWRAVTTIKLGEPSDPYPGDRVSEVRTRDYCSQSVAAWLNYPTDFKYGYTWFHQSEWDSGNRRSVCWARTPQ